MHGLDRPRRSRVRRVDVVYHQAHEVRIHAHELAHPAHEIGEPEREP